MSVFKISILFVSFYGLIYFENANACHPRLISGDTIVCVCNSTHTCDGQLEHLNELSPKVGIACQFLSSKAGARLEKLADLQFTASAPNETFNLEITINRNVTFQKIIGFGSAFSDSAGYNIARLPETLQGRLVADFFASDGLEYRLGRVTIGGSDFSTRAYSNDDSQVDDENFTRFALQPEDLKWKIPYLRMAQEISNHTLKWFGSAWSSPGWMKTNGQLNHGGFLRGAPGGPYYKAYARYLIRFIREYAKKQVPFWGLTVVNEPGFGNETDWDYNCLGFTAQTQRDFIKLDLGPELAAANLSHLALMHYDFNIDHLEEYVDAILGDPATAKFVSGTAYHWYERKNPHFKRTLLSKIARMYPEKILLSTEACAGHYNRSTFLGSWNNFNEYADDIIQVLNNDVQGWIDWNIALDMNGGPSWAGTIVGAPVHVSDDGSEYFKVPQYYALGHFSKFILPESVRLEHALKADPKNVSEKIQAIVFKRPDKRIVLTILNMNQQKVSLKIVDPVRGYLTLELAEESMESIIWQ